MKSLFYISTARSRRCGASGRRRVDGAVEEARAELLDLGASYVGVKSTLSKHDSILMVVCAAGERVLILGSW